MMAGNHSLIIALIAASLGFGRLATRAVSPVVAPEPIKDSFCLDCHSDKSLTMTNAAGRSVFLFVDPAKISASVHKTITCASCHTDITAKHPDDGVVARPVSCQSCHEPQAESYGASVHGIASKAGRAAAPGCQ